MSRVGQYPAQLLMTIKSFDCINYWKVQDSGAGL